MEFNLIAMATVGGAVAGLVQLGKGLKDTNEKYKESEELIKKLTLEKMKYEKEISKSSKAIERAVELKNKEQALNEEYQKATKQLELLNKKYVQQGDHSESLSKKIKEQTVIVEKLNKQKERQKHVFESARSSIETETSNLKIYGEKVTKVNDKLEILTKTKERYDRLNSNAEKLKNLGNKALGIGTAIGGSLSIPISQFMQVEDAQADLRKILGDEAQKYYKDLQEISKKSALS